MSDRGNQQPRQREISKLLRERGNRVTTQRRAVLKIIQEHEGHLSADEIYNLARDDVPRLSLSTVYRTLDLLKELDLVTELHLAGDHYRYEAQSGRHQHLVCLGCGKVIEFECLHCAAMHKELLSKHGFAITSSRVELLGYCKECAKGLDN